jgi:large subunit ribosomal protein L3
MSEQPAETAVAEKPAATATLKALLGQKVGMTQIFDAQGQVVPVTVIQAGPCHVTLVRTAEKDGYAAIQVSFGAAKEKWATKPHAGHFKKANVPLARWMREFRTDKAPEFQVGQVLKVDVFAPGDYVDVSGVSKGKGFAGTVKRHHFAGGPSTHGQSDRQRAPGSIGSNTYPGHVFKGQRMAGHMGDVRATVQHLEIVEILPEKDLLMVKGAIPGPNRSLVEIKQTLKRMKVKVAVHHEPTKKAKKEAAKAPAAAAKPKAAAK